MAELTRFGISIDARLLQQFDKMISSKGYVNRSEAIRDLIRAALVEEEWGDANQQTVATVTLVYDHHTRDLADKVARADYVIDNSAALSLTRQNVVALYHYLTSAASSS
jgi:CopG family nickel-responsive transcriptional regulator